MTTLNLHPHTILFLMGPSGCGKTYFTHNYLKPVLEDFNVQHVSSDAIRQDLLGQAYDKYDRRMLQVSSQAFDLLYHQVKNLSSYSVNAEFIVVDTKGFYPGFQKKIRELAEQNHYRFEIIVFDYEHPKDYFQFFSPQEEPWILNMVQRDIAQLHRAVSSLKQSECHALHRLQSPHFERLSFEVQGKAFYQKCHLKPDQKYRLVGDVHGCLEALKEVYALSQGRGETLILLGDVIDKGPQTKEVVEFLYEHRDEIILIKGNHENFVYKWLKGQINPQHIEPHTLDYFDSIDLFKQDKKLCQKFFALVEQATEFVRHPHFIASHAPCENKYLGKMDPASLKAQRNLRFPRRADYESDEAYVDSLRTLLHFLKQEENAVHPFHVFAHMALKDQFLAKNKICLDNGCVHGNGLTSLIFDAKTLAPHFTQTPSSLTPEQRKESFLPQIY